MPKQIVNPYTVTAGELKQGDIMLLTIKCSIVHHRIEGKLVYRVYRCSYPPNFSPPSEIPQYTKLPPKLAAKVASALFPVVTWANAVADPK